MFKRRKIYFGYASKRVKGGNGDSEKDYIHFHEVYFRHDMPFCV